jgi:leucyl-tRNA synthetase
MSRFLSRLWRLVYQHRTTGQGAAGGVRDGLALDLHRRTHRTIERVTVDVEQRFHFNTAIAAIMELLNELGRFEARTPADRAVVQELLESVVLMLSPIVPHICHRLWRMLGHARATVDERWPVADETALAADNMEIVVQVNGKVRGRISVPVAAAEDVVRAAALADDNVSRHVAGKSIRRVIIVPGKLVNIVV